MKVPGNVPEDGVKAGAYVVAGSAEVGYVRAGDEGGGTTSGGAELELWQLE